MVDWQAVISDEVQTIKVRYLWPSLIQEKIAFYSCCNHRYCKCLYRTHNHK